MSELGALLSGRHRLPVSPVIPSLNFGGDVGGSCDLQFVINQLISASSGVNLVQVLCAAIHLVNEMDQNLLQQLQAIEQGDAPYDSASDTERQILQRYVVQNRRGLQGSLLHLESVMAVLMPTFAHERIQWLRQHNLLDSDLPTFRSRLLISDELLRDLELERQVVSDYLHHDLASS